MAEIGAPYTLVTDGGSVDFNTRYSWLDGDGKVIEYFMTDVAGLDGNPSTRTPIEDYPITDGGLVFDFYEGPRHMTFTGYVLAPDVAGRNTLEDTLTTVCKAAQRSDGTLTYSPTGGSPKTWTVRCDVQPSYPGQGVLKEFIFGLVAAVPDPT